MSCGSTSISSPACTAANRASAAFLLLTKAAPEVALVIRMRASRAFCFFVCEPSKSRFAVVQGKNTERERERERERGLS